MLIGGFIQLSHTPEVASHPNTYDRARFSPKTLKTPLAKIFRIMGVDAILCCADGTSKRSEAKYLALMQNSFVSTIHKRSTTSFNFYFRGPGKLGGGTHGTAKNIARTVKSLHAIAGRDQTPVWLVGYSRGGVAALYASYLLGLEKIPVDRLILFDAVDEAWLIRDALVNRVPENVKWVLHVRKSAEAGSRENFRVCGIGCKSTKSVYIERSYLTTHGGAGGCPWALDDPERFRPKLMNHKLVVSPEWDKCISEGFPAGDAQLSYLQDLEGSKLAWAETAQTLVSIGIINDACWPRSVDEENTRKPKL